MSQQLTKILNGLREEEQRLKAELKQWRETGEPLHAELERVQAGIAGLTGQSPRKKKATSGSGGGGVTKAEVIGLIQDAQRQSPDLSDDHDKLKKHVESKLRSNNRRLTGFPLRFSQAIKALDEKNGVAQ